MKTIKNKWFSAIMIIFLLAILSFIVSGFISVFLGGEASGGNVAIIPIKGVIIVDNLKIFGQQVSSSSSIIDSIKKANKNPEIKAIVFEINSPGGSAVASEEIANTIKKTNKTTIAWIREIGTSGAYWIASSCDKIVANRMSITGSIGVLASYLEFSGLLQDYNITYQRLVSGEYKDIGSPFKHLTEEERRLFQSRIDKIHEFFIEEVAKNRNISEERVREIATGMFYLGGEAKEMGLIDVLGGKEEVKEIIEKELNISVSFVSYKEEKKLIDLLGELLSEQSFFMGRGIGSSLFDMRTIRGLEVWT